MVTKAEMKGLYLPIIPRSGLYLVSTNGEQAKRFAELFAETWRQMPPWARKTILQYWRQKRPSGWPKDLHWPKIEYSDCWTSRSRRQATGDACGHDGEIRFSAKQCDLALRGGADGMVRRLIAHELAHVLQFASPRDENVADTLAKVWTEQVNP